MTALYEELGDRARHVFVNKQQQEGEGLLRDA